MSAPLQVRPADFPPVGFSTAASARAWVAACRPCGSGGVPLLVARSSGRVGSRTQELRTHCRNGHELSGDNVYRRPNPKPGKRGERVCRACESERSKKRWKAQKTKGAAA